jgi:PelA/Pel-15E family pectate lyase
MTANRRPLFHFGILFATLVGVAPAVHAAAAWFEPVTLERVIALPAAEQRPWLEYVARSQKLLLSEREFRAAEARAARVPELKLAPYATLFGVNLDQPVEWFATDEGKRITAIVLSYQTPNGGWSKRLDLSKEPRPRGTDFVSEHNAHYEGTFDNDSTTTQLRAVARAFKATGNPAARESFLRGLNYIFIAQYPNGGWPQIFPLETGYHDSVTFNDDAMVNIITLLRAIAGGTGEFDFVPADLRREAGQRAERGIACTLACQIRVDGKLTAWCQQHDALTLQPTGARAFEPAGTCSAESASVMRMLMELPAPSPAIIAAVDGAAAWFKQTAISGFAWRNTPDNGRLLVPAPGAGPLWSRISEVGTNRPIFGNPDRTIHYDVAEITRERRGGYNWYNASPATALARYDTWHANLSSR